jgi:hypothetical protein
MLKQKGLFFCDAERFAGLHERAVMSGALLRRSTE